MSILNEKLNSILNTIKEIGEYDQGIYAIMMDGFALSVRTIQEVAKKDADEKIIDINQQIEMVTNALGFSIEDIVIQAIDNRSKMQAQQQSYPIGTFDPNKEADNDTLSFIIGSNTPVEWAKEESSEEITNIIMNSQETVETKDDNVDDYERFLAKAKENLDFLKTQI